MLRGKREATQSSTFANMVLPFVGRTYIICLCLPKHKGFAMCYYRANQAEWRLMLDVLIDGDRYIKQGETVGAKVGIGITTHNRNALVASTVAKILALTPGARVVVVDDASEQPVRIDGVEVYRFKRNAGIAKAKNKCLELLSDCEHIFLFDDDTYPLKPGWERPYIDSKEHHLMYLFEDWASGTPVGDDKVIYEDGLIVAHDHARGCMLYVDRLVLDTVGGMDVRYGKAMNEHLDWSNRIYNAGLTTFKYMDVPDGSKLIHSMDEYQEVASSISKIERRFNKQNNEQLLAESLTSTRYAPYGKNVVIACYFSGVPDAQRDDKPWETDLRPIKKLRDSVAFYGYELILIHNCFDLPNLTTISKSPYFERWLKEWQYLRDHPEIENVFLVDATDVDMLRDPFPHIKPGTLYVGDEPTQTLSNQWLRSRHPNFMPYFDKNADKVMLNCGVVGGDRKTVMEAIKPIYGYGFEEGSEPTEMGVFNYIMYTQFADRIEYGRHVTTLFKEYERGAQAWFRHK